MRIYIVFLTALLTTGLCWGKDDSESAESDLAREYYEEMFDQGERWMCNGEVFLLLVGDFDGTTGADPGVGLFMAAMDFENPKSMNTFIEGLNTRTWLRLRQYGGEGWMEAEEFRLKPTDVELLSNVPVQGTYSRLLVHPDEEFEPSSYEESEFRCQRFDGWRFVEKDEQSEYGIATWNGVDLEVQKTEESSND